MSDVPRCPACGSVFRFTHTCGAPPTVPGRALPNCVCGHPLASHHRAPSGNLGYCTVWTSILGSRCPCDKARHG